MGYQIKIKIKYFKKSRCSDNNVQYIYIYKLKLIIFFLIIMKNKVAEFFKCILV